MRPEDETLFTEWFDEFFDSTKEHLEANLRHVTEDPSEEAILGQQQMIRQKMEEMLKSPFKTIGDFVGNDLDNMKPQTEEIQRQLDSGVPEKDLKAQIFEFAFNPRTDCFNDFDLLVSDQTRKLKKKAKEAAEETEEFFSKLEMLAAILEMDEEDLDKESEEFEAMEH
ncbi:hypothetical protein L596_012589 [Steinernema carpocapsae]|uniref:Uncharacterized protein n=1 Tax=Steinernema carpocapsae TaxID=34508 RepID=A0A4U5NXV4_STECR|nr:hypothetical protein L596_012589 [Steinernema carpocapsae]